MFMRNGLCDFCKDEKFAVVTIKIGEDVKQICHYCLEDKFDKEYEKDA